MEDKQNLTINQNIYFNRPSHQGRAFKLDLGHNNGPFLAKDVMYSNKKSAYLIAARHVLQSHQSMASLLGQLNKEVENQQRTVRNECKVQSWFSKCEYFEEELKSIEHDLKKLKTEQDRLKVELKTDLLRLNNENKQLSQNFIPILKNMLKVIRQQNSEQANIFEQERRTIEDLGSFRNAYLDQLINCQRRIIKTQDFLGVDQKDNDNDQD